METNAAGAEVEAERAVDRGIGESEETESGLDENVAGALAYLVGFISGLVFYLIEKENEYVRFHAAQSMVVSAAVFLLWVGMSVASMVLTTMSAGSGFFAFGLLSLLLSLVWLFVFLGAVGLWVFLLIRAYQGKKTRIPVAAGIADGLL